MPDLQVAGVGLTTIDVLARLEEMPTWQKGAFLGEIGFDGGGPVGTALVAAARLGVRTGYVGICGNDEAAGLKLLYLTRDGVDTSRVMARQKPENQLVLVFVQQSSGDRVFGLIIDQDDALRPEELDRDYITSADYLHLDGYHQKAALQAAQWMHAADKKVMLDAPRGNADLRHVIGELVEVCDVLIGGSGVCQELSGKSDFWDAGEAVLRMGPQVVVQTEGEEGSTTITASERFHTPAFPVEVVDTTGAGDVFHGAYLAGLLRGWDLRQTARFASAVAAIKCMHLGGRRGAPHEDEVSAFLKQRWADSSGW
jgi:sulfofructose kinase